MKGLLAVTLILAGLIGSGRAAKVAGTLCQPSSGVYHPNPLDCGSFLVCEHNVLLLRPCPSGLHWNQAALTCDWPNSAKCISGEVEDIPEEIGDISDKPGDRCDVGDPSNNVGLYRPHPFDCAQYLTCLHGRFEARPCGASLHWNAIQQTCDRAENANCANQISTEKPPSPSYPDTSPSPRWVCPPEDANGQETIILPHPNCGWFYLCENGRPTERPCPVGLEWNDLITSCDWPMFSGCVPGAAPAQPDSVLWSGAV